MCLMQRNEGLSIPQMTSFSFNLPSKQYQQEDIAYINKWHWMSGFVHVNAWKKWQDKKKGRNSQKGKKRRSQGMPFGSSCRSKIFCLWQNITGSHIRNRPDLADYNLWFCFSLWEIKQTRALLSLKRITIWCWCYKWEAPFVFEDSDEKKKCKQFNINGGLEAGRQTHTHFNGHGTWIAWLRVFQRL